MGFTRKCAFFLVLLICAVGLARPGLADDGDSAITLCDFPPMTGEGPYPCPDFGHGALGLADYSRPGSVMVLSKFAKARDTIAGCSAGNVFVTNECLPRTEVEVGVTCPTLFTVEGPITIPPSPSQPATPCPVHERVRVRFRWVCPGAQGFICKTSGFDVLLTVNGNVVFTADGSRLPDRNQVQVPPAPCEKGYLIGWVIDESGQPIKYDGLIGKAVIRYSGTAAAVYRAITIQANGEAQTRSVIDLVSDPLGSQRLGLPFFGSNFNEGSLQRYRVVTGQITGDITFDKPARGDAFDLGVSSSLILLTLDVRSNSPNYPTRVSLNFWNGFEEKISTSVKFVCWGEFQLSKDINPTLTQASMGTRTGIVQSDEAIKVEVPSISGSDIAGHTTLLGFVQTNEGLIGALTRSHIEEFYDNGIRYWSTAFFP
jgi:hypothetical protein